jgi:hypothetical protein
MDWGEEMDGVMGDGERASYTRVVRPLPAPIIFLVAIRLINTVANPSQQLWALRWSLPSVYREPGMQVEAQEYSYYAPASNHIGPRKGSSARWATILARCRHKAIHDIC